MSGDKLQDDNLREEKVVEVKMSGEERTKAATDEGSNLPVDEVIAGVFCSKRRTGQFNDRFETGELEFNQVFKNAANASPTTSSVKSADNWADCVVHDLAGHEFDTMDDIMEWPADYDESSEKF